MQHELIGRDKKVNWHPYSQMKTSSEIPIVRGSGASLFDAAGNRYIDAVSSWWVTLHGHAHPDIARALADQAGTLEQVIFAGFTHPWAIELSERLLALLPENQEKAFYSDNGSTAVEVALKMCIQYHANRNKKRQTILTFSNGYHGDTFGAMSVSSRNSWTSPFADFLFDVEFMEVPCKQNLERLKQLVDQRAADALCFIYEPLVQGAGGMLMHEAEALNELMNHCRQSGIMLIQDEVFTGFGRTGKLFAADHLTFSPDVMCFSKGLTGGTMPLGMTTCTNKLYDAFYADDKRKAFFHGHSFTANPLACRAALTSLDLLLKEETQYAIRRITDQHTRFAMTLSDYDENIPVRQCGTILAVDIPGYGDTGYFNTGQQRLYDFFLSRGILLRPMGNTLYLLPPYCISEQDLHYCYQAIMELFEQQRSKFRKVEPPV